MQLVTARMLEHQHANRSCRHVMSPWMWISDCGHEQNISSQSLFLKCLIISIASVIQDIYNSSLHQHSQELIFLSIHLCYEYNKLTNTAQVYIILYYIVLWCVTGKVQLPQGLSWCCWCLRQWMRHGTWFDLSLVASQEVKPLFFLRHHFFFLLSFKFWHMLSLVIKVPVEEKV